jgi:hypothetical protein
MLSEQRYINERLDHLGIVAGVCQEIGLAAWLDSQDPDHRKPRECRNGDGGYDPEWIRRKPPAIVFGAAVLREQTRRALVGSGDQGRDARVSTVWDVPWIGCTPMIPPDCLLASRAEHDRSLG